MPQNEMTARLKELQERAIRFGERNIQAGLAYASELARAKDFADVLSVQSRFAQAQMRNYALEMQELGEFVAEARESLQPTM